MRVITPNLTPELLSWIMNSTVSAANAYDILTFNELVEHIAKLSFLNKDYLLFFRGQQEDYRNRAGNTTLYPSIYRGDYLNQKELTYRFNYLNAAAKILANHFAAANLEGHRDVRRKTYIQWSILQHYEVCQTPLLDVTHSLRVAATFATNQNKTDSGYIYVLGLPYITNRISINSEHDLVNVRLLSICPPQALRPHYQEGFLTGTTDITNDYDAKMELDFNNRLIAKFKISTDKKFWGTHFSSLPEKAIYPDKDKVKDICEKVKLEANEMIMPGDLGEFINKWSDIEQYLLNMTSTERKSNSYIEALNIVKDKKMLDSDFLNQIEKLRKFRNELVHEPQKVSPKALNSYMDLLSDVTAAMMKKK